MEYFKKIEFCIDDLTDEAKAKFIRFLGGDNGNHDVIPIFTYETVCETEDCEGCEWECTKDNKESER